jgi:hypothetical protein
VCACGGAAAEGTGRGAGDRERGPAGAQRFRADGAADDTEGADGPDVAGWAERERALLAALPDAPSRCGVARLWRLAPARRAAAGAHLGVRGGPWLGAARVGATAWAERIDVRTGRRAEVLGFAGEPGTELAAALDAHAGLALRWVRRAPGGGDRDASACEGPDCAWSEARAETLGDALVVVRIGRWPARASPTDVRERCAALARREPDALDVRVALAPSPDATLEERVLRGGARGLTLEVRRACLDEEAARRERSRLDADLRALTDAAWRVRRVERAGTSVAATVSLDWEDAELLEGDRRRLAEALAHDAAMRRPLGPGDFDVRDPEALAAQALLHERALASATTSAGRRAAAEAFARLLAAALAAGASPAYGERLVRLHLDALDDAAGAAALARALQARGDASPSRLRALEREALARTDEAQLAAALLRDGVTPRGEAAAAAAALSASVRAGVPAPVAEGALAAAAAVAALIDGGRPRPTAPGSGAPRTAVAPRGTRAPPAGAATQGRAPGRAATAPRGALEAWPGEPLDPPVALPLAGLPAALDAIGALSTPDAWTARATYLLAVAEPSGAAGAPALPAPGAAHVPDGGQVALARVVGPRGAPAAMLAGRTDDGVARRTAAGRLLAAAVTGGRVAIVYVVVPLPSASGRATDPFTLAPAQVLALAGEVRDGALVVERVGVNARAVDWDAAARVLAAPLATLEARLFPPPEARVALRTADEAARAARNVVEAEVRADGPVLRLRAATASALGAALVELAEPLVGRALPLADGPPGRSPARRAASPRAPPGGTPRQGLPTAPSPR